MKSIILFTRYYPYSLNSEDFISNELDAVSNEYDITLVPFSRISDQKREIPRSVHINESCCNMSFIQKIAVVVSMLFSMRFWKMFLCRDFISCRTIARMTYYCKMVYGAFVIKWVVKNRKINYSPESVFYSYWLTYAPLGLAMLKQEGFIHNRVVTRTHGYEIYENGNYEPETYPHFPARLFTYKWIDKVYSISKKGIDILVANYPNYANKFEISHLGVNPIGMNKHNNEGYLAIVSCSYLYELKRVPLIFKSLNNFCSKYKHINIRWYHIGSSRYDYGRGFAKLKKETLMATENLKVSLLGEMSNQDVIKFYQNHRADIFINLSTTEGIPVSIMEAESAGLAILATDVGSNDEIVTEDVGVLLKVDFTQDEFDEALKRIISNHQNMSQMAMNNFYKEWHAGTNYTDFYHRIAN